MPDPRAIAQTIADYVDSAIHAADEGDDRPDIEPLVALFGGPSRSSQHTWKCAACRHEYQLNEPPDRCPFCRSADTLADITPPDAAPAPVAPPEAPEEGRRFVVIRQETKNQHGYQYAVDDTATDERAILVGGKDYREAQVRAHNIASALNRKEGEPGGNEMPHGVLKKINEHLRSTIDGLRESLRSAHAELAAQQEGEAWAEATAARINQRWAEEDAAAAHVITKSRQGGGRDKPPHYYMAGPRRETEAEALADLARWNEAERSDFDADLSAWADGEDPGAAGYVRPRDRQEGEHPEPPAEGEQPFRVVKHESTSGSYHWRVVAWTGEELEGHWLAESVATGQAALLNRLFAAPRQEASGDGELREAAEDAIAWFDQFALSSTANVIARRLRAALDAAPPGAAPPGEGVKPFGWAVPGSNLFTLHSETADNWEELGHSVVRVYAAPPPAMSEEGKRLAAELFRVVRLANLLLGGSTQHRCVQSKEIARYFPPLPGEQYPELEAAARQADAEAAARSAPSALPVEPLSEEVRELTFAAFRRANVERCEASFHAVDRWSPCDWMTAVAGEVGEAANLIKKRRRGEPVDTAEVGKEIADAVTYLDLLAHRLGVDLGTAVALKFNEVSRRVGSPVRLAAQGCSLAEALRDEGEATP